MSKSQRASMTSSALFIMDAESMVILRPMLQLGWRSACSFVAFMMSALSQVRNGPPLAVRISRSGLLPCAPCRHWKMALCSLSTGRSGWPAAFAAAVTSSPPATSGSLLASSTRLPQESASITAARPTTPTTDTSTSSASHARTTRVSTSSPNIHWQAFLMSSGICAGSTVSAAICGRKARTCSKSFSEEEWATSAVT